jgi:molybdopterin-guanine dinucleotide biosynthesis protein A
VHFLSTGNPVHISDKIIQSLSGFFWRIFMLSIVIQAGGESTRMGQDKALVPFLGAPLIQRVFERLAGLGDEILITTNHPEAYTFLPARLAPDPLPGRGALGGLYTALSAASQPLVAVVACDMPFVSAPLLRALRDRLVESGGEAAIPRSPGGLEPFHAVYRRESCLPMVKASLEAGQRRVDSWLAGAQIEFLTPEEVRRYDPRGMAFFNVNTPAELQQAEQIAKNLTPGE